MKSIKAAVYVLVWQDPLGVLLNKQKKNPKEQGAEQ